ncbi:MAG TPA: hypothetical protein VIT91_01760 [Chthoniobacterales bacterium]
MAAFMQPLIAEESIETPEQVLSSFYVHLLSDVTTKELPCLFADPTVFASALKWPDLKGVTDEAVANQAVWDYFRANRSLFLFDGIEPSQTVKKAGLSYCFVAFPHPATFFDGIFCIELIAPLSKGGGKDGVLKQIRFPLKKNEGPSGPGYLIEASMIAINGAGIDPSKEFDRTESFYRRLGFTSPSNR